MGKDESLRKCCEIIEEYQLLNEISDDEYFVIYFVKMFMCDEYVLDLYEKYCYENSYYENVFHPVHSIEDHFGVDVQNFLATNTDFMDLYAYYTIDENKKVTFYTEKEALECAEDNLVEHFEFVVENY